MKPQVRDSTGQRPRPGGRGGPKKVGVRQAFQRFESTLKARNLSPRTIRNYLDAAEGFAAFCEYRFGPLDLDEVTDEHVNVFIASQLEEHSPSTAATRFRCLQQFFRFAEGLYIDTSPMVGLRPPRVNDAPVPVLRDHELVRLLRACDGDTFRDRRDFAMLRLFIDAGVRRDELAGMTVDALDLEQRLIMIIGKGRQVRAISFGNESTLALERYLKVRAEHAYSADRHLWLGLKGPMTGDGVRQMVDRRSAGAGVEGVFPHRFRHTFAHRWLVAGGNETDLQTLAGWRSSQMLSRYGASARAERAALAHRRIALGDAIK
jgi:site-specific recombinase XerD